MSIRVPALFCCVVATAYAAILPGQNAYLPPKESGYNYPRPTVPFPPPPPTPSRPPPTPPRPTYLPPTRPPQPAVPSPSPFRPSARPPVPFRPTTTARPTYVPPPRPTGQGYLPPPTSPPFRPTPPPVRPTYGPPVPTRPAVPPGEGQSFQTFGENDHLLVPHKPGNPFDFKYAVKDQFGNDYSHNAINDGDTTNGEYRVQLPDGRVQVVKYVANWASGFKAKVSYEGQPTYPAPSPGNGGYPSQRPSGPSFPTPPVPARPSSPGGQPYAPNGGYKY